jgi:hypothetical protein
MLIPAGTQITKDLEVLSSITFIQRLTQNFATEIIISLVDLKQSWICEPIIIQKFRIGESF